jgi:Tfp pilus assembly protein PilV
MGTSRKATRGSTLIEVMIAMVVAIIGALGFVATANVAAANSTLSYRGTAAEMARTGVADLGPVLPRPWLNAAPQATWVRWTCFDTNSQLLATNSGLSGAFACPVGTLYDTWVNVQQGSGLYSATWSVQTYAERADRPCTVGAVVVSNGVKHWPTLKSSKGCSVSTSFISD